MEVKQDNKIKYIFLTVLIVVLVLGFLKFEQQFDSTQSQDKNLSDEFDSTEKAIDNVHSPTTSTTYQEEVLVNKSEPVTLRTWLVEPDFSEMRNLGRGFYTNEEKVYYSEPELAYTESVKHFFGKIPWTVTGVTPDEFEIIEATDESNIGGYYFSDGKNVFVVYREGYGYYTRELDGADPITFDIIEWPYTKDREHVFYYEEKLEGVDPNAMTFMGLTNPFSLFSSPRYVRSGTVMYYGDIRLENIDLSTARTQTIPGSEKVQGGVIEFLITSEKVYFEGKELVGISPVTMTTEMNGAVVRDGDTLYYMTGSCMGDRWYKLSPGPIRTYRPVWC